jgi:hypothetical protein
MPYINTTASVKIPADKEKRIAAALGKAIENFPGKTERWLMLNFTDGSSMYFAGDASAPSAMVEVKIFGTAPASAFDGMTRDICAIFGRELGIPADRVYVQYEECSRWGWNGGNF